jgi:hypothetical protein
MSSLKAKRATIGGAVLLLMAGAFGMTACTGGGSKASKAQASQNNIAANEANEFSAAVPYPFASSMPSDPLERKNLSRRLKYYNSKGSTNYVYVFAGMTDKVIGYYVITGKVSSTGSQMTSTDINVHCGYSGTNESCTNLAIGDDGSYGPSEGGDSGVFFFTTNGNLVETDQPFVVSSQPLKIYSDVPELDAPVSGGNTPTPSAAPKP